MVRSTNAGRVPTSAGMSFTISSPAFRDGEAIPPRYSKDQDDVSPALHISDVPERAKSMALVVEDPDAPDPKAPKRTFVHWIVYNLPANCRALPECADQGSLPPGARQGKNDWGATSYGGPQPPQGRHRYFFKLYALDEPLPDLGAPTKADLERAMAGHVVAQTELVGTFEQH